MYPNSSKLNITQENYSNSVPFPHLVQDSFLEESFARNLQREILDIPDSMWDRYDNPFEQKYTLRDKYNFPTLLTNLFTMLTSQEFVNDLSNVVGHKLLLDTTRNFWGVHKYNPGDYLDIHVDAGLHPTLKIKKQVTLGIYLSVNWKEEYGCQLEFWKGENAAKNDAQIFEKNTSVAPFFNRLIVFTCNDYSWHGNPEPVQAPPEAKRIFITISYLSENTNDLNKRVKAFFVKRPNDPDDPEKDKLRLLRADPELYKNVYRV